MRNQLVLSAIVLLAAACGRENGFVDGGTNTATTDAGTSTGADAGPSTFTVTTVANAWANLASLSGGGVEIDGAIVVSANSYTSTSSKCGTVKEVETFYIQDATGGAGVAVYHGCTDSGDFPNVGDVVMVRGRLSKFDGSLQISSSTKYNIALSVHVTQAGGGDGKAKAGAYPPAGSPTVVATADQSGYAHSVANPHPEMLGTALHFGGVAVTDPHPAGFTKSPQDAGAVLPEGFEITGGIWVDDNAIYSTCIKPLTADGGMLTLNAGVTGMWDKYQDYYGTGIDGGYAPVVPILVPQNCSDLGL